jgi:RNA polymerase sigma factor (TIGR02999 family)
MCKPSDGVDGAAAPDGQNAAKLLPLVYDELRKLATARMAAESSDNTLQPTALVHEAYLRLAKSEGPAGWANRGQFFAAAAEAMRRILIESARRKSTHKRGQSAKRSELDPDQLATLPRDLEQWIDLDSVLTCFEAVDPRAAEVAKLRIFGGLSVEEAAEALSLSRANAYRMWTYAQAWLSAALKTQGEPAE